MPFEIPLAKICNTDPQLINHKILDGNLADCGVIFRLCVNLPSYLLWCHFMLIGINSVHIYSGSQAVLSFYYLLKWSRFSGSGPLLLQTQGL